MKGAPPLGFGVQGLRPWTGVSKGVKPLCWGLGTAGPQVKLVQGGGVGAKKIK